jgi:ABC-type phosphate transport system substrate-binding protein
MRILHFLSLVFLVELTSFARADLVLVTNPQSGIERLTQDEVINIYLGRYRRLASGMVAEPFDHPIDSELRSRFYRRLVNKNLAEINAYWARLVFSGKTRPPQVIENADSVLRQIASQPGALAYVERSQVDTRVKIVFELGD